MNYTQQQFNEMAAKAEGETISYDYYNDINYLIHLFRKLDDKQAIRDCLWQIWSEGNTNE